MSELKKRQAKLAYVAYRNGLISQGAYNALLVTPASHDVCELILDVSAGMVNGDDAFRRIQREAVQRLSA